MKYIKKSVALVLTAVMLIACLIPMSAFAATKTDTGFSDINDIATAQNVEVLHMMGVLGGYTDGSFRPNANLNRGEFCKMAIVMMGKSDLASQYRSYTIFPDVKSSHWAAGYINLAAKGETKIIAGFADGTFGPSKNITYGEAVTILMRMQGYADADVGAVWPNGYISAAITSGLANGMTDLKGSSTITRAQAAMLFSNALRTNDKSGTMYGTKLAATSVADAVLTSCNALASDGSTGALEIAGGKTYKMAYNSGNGVLNGRKGTLLLDKNNKVITFVPTAAGSFSTITVALAKAGYITDSEGHKYTISATADAYYNGEKKTYGDIFSWLTAGNTVTIYFNAGGTAEYIFVGKASTSLQAIIISATGSTAGFETLTSNNNSYAIYKNGSKASTGDLRQYDVATYDSVTNSVRVSDTRISGYYEDCYPNNEAPTSVTVLGHKFNVLSSAMDTISKFKVGTQITLLLTEDNQVAGAVDSSSSGSAARGNAVGIVTKISSGSATVQLLNGLTISGDPRISSSMEMNKYNGQLVRVNSTGTGRIALSRLSGMSSSYTFDVAKRMVGSAPLADNVIIYEQVGTSVLKTISISQITVAKVSDTQVNYVSKDWAGRVNILVLNDVTGDGYTYGRAVCTEGSDTGTNATISVENGAAKLGPFATGLYCRDGSYIGVAATADGSKISNLITLEKLEKVNNSAWSGEKSVTIGGKIYTVSEDVVCYNATSRKWITLNAAHAFATVSDLYTDSHNVIRVVEVK